MGKFFQELSREHQVFISRQKVFFTGTAAEEGRVNVSPKGLDVLRVLAPDRIAYLDVTGSGNETAAHLLRLPRITVMFCSFDADPLILRAYGRGRSVLPRDSDWQQMRPLFGEPRPGERQIIDVRVESVQTSCGFGVPQMEFSAHRTLLGTWAEKKGPEGIAQYWRDKNSRSIDGFPTSLSTP